MSKLKHILEAEQFGREWLEEELFPLALKMEEIVESTKRGADCKILSGKGMIVFFYEPSTRTRASFEIAMGLMGGQVVFSTDNAKQFSSAVKGETVRDTFKVLNRYLPDVIVSRFAVEGDAKIAAEVSVAPIINAGDGTGQHPTQALLDIFTIQKKLGHVDNISIAMVGDLAKGRTVRSLCYLLGKFEDIKIHFVSPQNLRMRDDIMSYLDRHNVQYSEAVDLKSVAGSVDVVYMTRAQKERGTVFSEEAEELYMMNTATADKMKESAIIMHPLPRTAEITLEVDANPRAIYITDQVDSGLYIRMALLKMLLKG